MTEERPPITWEQAYADWTWEMRQIRRIDLSYSRKQFLKSKWILIGTFLWGLGFLIWDLWHLLIHHNYYMLIPLVLQLAVFYCLSRVYRVASWKLDNLEAQLIELDRRDALDSQ